MIFNKNKFIISTIILINILLGCSDDNYDKINGLSKLDSPSENFYVYLRNDVMKKEMIIENYDKISPFIYDIVIDIAYLKIDDFLNKVNKDSLQTLHYFFNKVYLTREFFSESDLISYFVSNVDNEKYDPGLIDYKLFFQNKNNPNSFNFQFRKCYNENKLKVIISKSFNRNCYEYIPETEQFLIYFDCEFFSEQNRNKGLQIGTIINPNEILFQIDNDEAKFSYHVGRENLNLCSDNPDSPTDYISLPAKEFKYGR
ncbi:MAG: hypothetical protein MH321_03755 [Leptospiraceae bacterium]|nr:hypothetical protein [Leptospiraceae bacterium]